MINLNKNLSYFCLGILTAILGWCAYTLYHIFGKPVLPIEPKKQNFSEVDWEDLKKTMYSSKNSLDPDSLDNLRLDDLGPKDDCFEWTGRITYPDSNSLSDLDDI